MTEDGAALVDALLHGPRGLIGLAELAGIARQALPSALSDPTRRAGGLGVTDPRLLTEADRLAALLVDVTDGATWDPSVAAMLPALRAASETLRPVADTVVSSAAARWWSDDLAPGDQVTLGPAHTAPDVEALADEQHRMVATWPESRPPQVLTTARWLGDRLPSSRLRVAEATYRWGDPVGCWSVTVDPAARVYEIHRPGDWVALCERHPHRSTTGPPSLRPDWPAVVAEWDGIHVSLAGMLSAVGTPLTIEGRSCVLEDVDSEMTTWFRPVLSHPRHLGDRPGDRTPW